MPDSPSAVWTVTKTVSCLTKDCIASTRTTAGSRSTSWTSMRSIRVMLCFLEEGTARLI